MTDPTQDLKRCGGSRTQPDKRGATSVAGCPGCPDCDPPKGGDASAGRVDPDAANGTRVAEAASTSPGAASSTSQVEGVLRHFESEADAADELALTSPDAGTECSRYKVSRRRRYEIERDTYRYVLEQIRTPLATQPDTASSTSEGKRVVFKSNGHEGTVLAEAHGLVRVVWDEATQVAGELKDSWVQPEHIAPRLGPMGREIFEAATQPSDSDIREKLKELERFTGAHIAAEERDGLYVEIGAVEAALAETSEEKAEGTKFTFHGRQRFDTALDLLTEVIRAANPGQTITIQRDHVDEDGHYFTVEVLPYASQIQINAVTQETSGPTEGEQR